MASIARDANGCKRIQFVARDGSRKAIRLGKCSQRDAESFKIKVEALLSANMLGNSPDRETSEWLAGRSDDLLDKLAGVGLIEARHRSEPVAVVTLAAFLADYLERRTGDVKGGTSVFYGHTVHNLIKFFGTAKPLADIHPGDADDFQRYLRNAVRGTRTAARLPNVATAKPTSEKAPAKKLSPATIVRRCALARTFFKDAVRRKLIDSNPFDGVGKGSTANPDRQRFIDRATIAKVIDACPNAEWRLLVALSRYAGLRVPSEPLLLRWQDIDLAAGRMLVHSPKTEHHPGKGTRMVPIFPELRPYLEDAHELAVVGAEFVLPSLRKSGAATGDWRSVNVGTQFGKIIKRAGLVAWPRAWHNLRSSRQTELTETFPSHVVTAWLGNSERIAEKHYLQVLDSHFDRAVQDNTPEKAAQKQAQLVSESLGNASHPSAAENEKPLVLQNNTTKQGVCESNLWAILDSNQ